MLLAFIFLLLGIPILIGYFLTRKKGNTHPSQNKDWYLQLSLSKEDTVSQWFLLLSVFFLGVTMLSFNRDLGDPITWRTIVFLTSIIGLLCAYYFKVISTLIVSLIGVVVWWVSQAYVWLQDKEIQTSSIFTGLALIALLFYVLGHFHEKDLKYKRFALVYLILGIISVTGILFFASTKAGLGVLGEMTKGVSFFGSWQITLSLLVFSIAIIGSTLYSVVRKLIFLPEATVILILTLLFGIIAFLPQQNIFVQSGSYLDYYSNNELSASGVLWAVIFNFAVFLALLGLIFSGYLRREEWLINVGTVFLFLLILIKYFDWFFTFLDKSIFFTGAGILLFGVGWFMEKGRRMVVSNIKAEGQPVAKQ